MKNLISSSVRNQLLAAFLVVIVAFAVALVIAITGISSVAKTTRAGYAEAIVAQEAASAARDMRGSEIANALSNGKQLANHEGDVQAFKAKLSRLDTSVNTAADRASRAHVEAAFKAWQALDRRIG